MNLTNHIVERYVERVKNITERNKMKQYVAQNRTQIEEWLEKQIEYSQIIFEGKLAKDTKPMRYLLSGNSIIVQDPSNSNYVTIYNCDYGYPGSINNDIKNKLLEELEIKKQKHTSECNTIDENVKGLNKDIMKLQGEIKSLKKQLQTKEEHLESTLQYRDTLDQQKDITMANIEELIKMLCRPIDYQADFHLTKN